MEIECCTPALQPERGRNIAAFWLLGLLNNMAYVVMIAGATTISSASVGLVFLCAVGPGLIVKATGPYWFHAVPYRVRSVAIAALMGISYTTVALSGSRGWQLLGVVFASLQGGLGEATTLSLTAYYRSGTAITAWSSGTGFAGIAG
jgi:battenin